MKIVINSCFGGFDLSYKASLLYGELSGFKLYAFTNEVVNGRHDFEHYVPYIPEGSERTRLFPIVCYAKEPLRENGLLVEHSYFSNNDIARDDPNLVKVVEKLGEDASTGVSNLKVVEIPDGTEWEIEDYDGLETIHEKHQSWS